VVSGMADLRLSPPPDGTLIVGWAGSDTHAGDFAILPAGLFRQINADRRLIVHAIGPNYFSRLGVHPGKIAHDPWFDDLVDYYRHLNFDIALIPLADNGFNRSKSAVKFLEMSALGIPSIASAAGPYADVVDHGRTGFLARSERDWSKYLTKLINSPDLRARIGSAAREWARTQTVDRHAALWEQALIEITS
jgi:glycosyltransferase involved in cell wall biosynthesis